MSAVHFVVTANRQEVMFREKRFRFKLAYESLLLTIDLPAKRIKFSI